jgi:integrase/recombinase XerD
MALTRQAKILTEKQIRAALAYLASTRHAERNTLIFLLSMRQGMRAKEIANLTWEMVLLSDGTLGPALNIWNQASKGKTSGRSIPIHPQVRSSLEAIKPMIASGPVIRTQKNTSRKQGTSSQMIVNLFKHWYSSLGYQGSSSHSGRRTCVTTWAKKCSQVNGTLRDVMALTGHKNLGSVQRYIEYNTEAQTALINS